MTSGKPDKEHFAAISQQIWGMKYRLRDDDGRPVDKSLPDSWRRIARALAAPETDAQVWEQRFYEAQEGFAFLPAGRIIAGAGSDTKRRVTLFNCFVMGRVPDDMGGIFEHLREAALTLQQGGGIGFDFSTLRPKGAPVAGVGADASGPLSFMDVWDAMCRTIMSAGSRRGAMMGTLRCDHPDIESFIEAKRDPRRLRNFNLSVLVSDAFMAAVAEDADWALQFDGKRYSSLRARALWERIMRAAYDSAEPGVIFIDRVNQLNPLSYCEEIYATNPCGEQPLPPYGACLLGSLNLAALVKWPFTRRAELDLARLEALVPVALRLLDNAIDVSRFPLPQQRHEAQAKRRVGLGVTGLADALIMCGLRYGAPEAVKQSETWLAALRDSAYRASIELAREKGAFPLFDKERYLAGPLATSLNPEIREGIARHGIRNGLLTSVAPTGTISLLANNVSSGIEPVFGFTHQRTILLPDGSRQSETVEDFAYSLFRRLKGETAPLTPAFVEARDITPEAHLAMQAAVQRYIDSAVSKTINLPEEISFEDFKGIYARAYELGCKGCTAYRPNPITGAVLAPEAAEPQAAPRAERRIAPQRAGSDVVYMTQPLDRPEILPGRSYKLRWPESDHAIYITINDIIRDGRRCPFEIFINSKNMEHYAWTVALTRMISAVFRRGGDVSFVVEELKAVFDPRGGAWLGGRYVPSLLAAIGGVIERHMIDIGFLPTAEAGEIGEMGAAKVVNLPEGRGTATLPRQCPKCGEAAVVHQEGCDLCTSCGYSRCG